MRLLTPRILIGLALCAVASSCANRVETLHTFPPAADLVATDEPAFPIAALEPTLAGKAAEDAWWNEVLLWGRDHHGKVARICKWAVDLGYKAPKGFCPN